MIRGVDHQTCANLTNTEGPEDALTESVRIMDDTHLAEGVDPSADSDGDDQTADAEYGLANFPRALEATFEEELKDNLEDPSVIAPPENTLIHDKVSESNEAQSAQRNANTHERTMNEPLARKSPAAASVAVTSVASPHSGAKIDALGNMSTATSNIEPRLKNLTAIKH